MGEADASYNAGMDRQPGPKDLWNVACLTGMLHTAYGILFDMFTLWDLLETDPESPATEHQVASFKEELMHILDDRDGAQLREWRHLWQSDRYAFEKRAHRRIQACVDHLRSN